MNQNMLGTSYLATAAAVIHTPHQSSGFEWLQKAGGGISDDKVSRQKTDHL